MASYSQRLLEAATLMRSGQGGGSTNEGLTVVVSVESDLVLVKDPVVTQLTGATVGGWTEYAGNTGVTRYGLPQIP